MTGLTPHWKAFKPNVLQQRWNHLCVCGGQFITAYTWASIDGQNSMLSKSIMAIKSEIYKTQGFEIKIM